MRRLRKLMSLLVVVFSLPTIAQQSMSLGDLKFVMPSSEVSSSARMLSMRMATTGISPKIYARVGGVAFIQTATPEFTVNSLSLDCNYVDNSAYAVINDTTYEIPLEVWELKSIVNYADSEYNAAVTLFGDYDAKIKYHAALLDNLMGLRVLQSDMMLTANDVWLLPSDDKGEYIMSLKERETYDAYNDLYTIFEFSYEEMALYSRIMLEYYIDSIGEKYDTYIYTDYNQSITFNVEEGDIVINGSPYYRFAYRDSVMVDTLEMYYVLKDYIKMYDDKVSMYKNLSVSDVFNSTSKKIKELRKLTKNNKNVMKKSREIFEVIDYYSLCDTFDIEDNFIKKIPEIVKDSLTIYTDSIVENGCENIELYNVSKEFVSIEKDLKYYDYPIVTEYVNYIYELIPNDSTIIGLKEITSEYNLTYDKLLIDYLYDSRIPAVREVEKVTDFVRSNQGLVYMMNPIVYDATNKLCQWSAFFRYVKENHNDEWVAFINKIDGLKYDAPIIQTPIDYYYE